MIDSIISRVLAISLTFSASVLSNSLFAETIPQSSSKFTNEPLTIVITGSQILQDDERSASTITVIDKETIESLNPRNVSQLLSTLPGFHVESSSARGNINGLYLRGGDPNFTLVLINGVKVNDPTNSRGGAFDFALLDINSIERIEIVTGPASSLYGSDAMAGVINIITRKPSDEITSDARVEAGANGLFNASVFAGNSSDKGNISLNMSYADDGEQIEGSGYESNSARIGGEYEVLENTLFSLNFSIKDAKTQSYPDASGGPEYAVIHDVDKRDAQLQVHNMALLYELSSHERVNLQFNYYQSEELYDSVGIDSAIPPSVTNSDYQRQNALLSYSGKLTSDFNTSIGAEMQWEDGESIGVIDPNGFNIPTDFMLNRRMPALFGELQYKMRAQWRAYIGLRVDSPEEFSTETSPRLGLSYQHDKTTYSFDWGQGFKLPSFYALAHPIIGNPDFIPETSESYQLAIRHNFSSKTEATLAGFWTNYYDLIDFDSTSNVLVQRSEVEINGIEIHFKHQFMPSLSMQFQYTWMELDIIDSNEKLLKRPDRTGGVVIDWLANKDITISFAAHYVGEINDFAFPTGFRTLDSYTRADVSLGWVWNKHWRGQLSVDNVFDVDYEEAIGFKAPGVGARFSITASL